MHCLFKNKYFVCVIPTPKVNSFNLLLFLKIMQFNYFYSLCCFLCCSVQVDVSGRMAGAENSRESWGQNFKRLLRLSCSFSSFISFHSTPDKENTFKFIFYITCITFHFKKYLKVIGYRNTPVLHDVQYVQLYRIEIVQYKDEPYNYKCLKKKYYIKKNAISHTFYDIIKIKFKGSICSCILYIC